MEMATLTTGGNELVCPTCTFCNHPDLRACEMCDTPLLRPAADDGAIATAATAKTKPDSFASDELSDAEEEVGTWGAAAPAAAAAAPAAAAAAVATGRLVTGVGAATGAFLLPALAPRPAPASVPAFYGGGEPLLVEDAIAATVTVAASAAAAANSGSAGAMCASPRLLFLRLEGGEFTLRSSDGHFLVFGPADTPYLRVEADMDADAFFEEAYAAGVALRVVGARGGGGVLPVALPSEAAVASFHSSSAVLRGSSRDSGDSEGAVLLPARPAMPFDEPPPGALVAGSLLSWDAAGDGSGGSGTAPLSASNAAVDFDIAFLGSAITLQAAPPLRLEESVVHSRPPLCSLPLEEAVPSVLAHAPPLSAVGAAARIVEPPSASLCAPPLIDDGSSSGGAAPLMPAFSFAPPLAPAPAPHAHAPPLSLAAPLFVRGPLHSEVGSIPPAPPPLMLPQVLLLVGLPGAGKSTFATRLCGLAPSFVRVNQDELGDRWACESAVATALRSGRSVCVDRCNFNAEQRAHWVRLAVAAGVGHRVSVLFLNVDRAECERRAAARVGHPTITPANARSVIAQMAGAFTPPHASEGFATVYVAASPAQVAAALARVVGSARGGR